ncbi:hypothetical protein WJR50_32725 [Catalinimonas sp. 4WD22]|uniref:hypothetical protein n=1 Tax=Catalinimonas locisalis TaxID=3133978 RepID=UPI003100F8D8
MSTLILQAQSPAGAAPAGAALEIFLMLLVAAIIGFLTAYFYYRWKHKSSTSSELIKFQNRSKQLERDKELLQNDYNKLQKKYEASLALQKEAVTEIDDARLNNTNLKHQLEEKDEVLQRIAQKKHLLNYDSFGRASENEIDDLKKISGIGPFIQTKLHALDIYTFRQIANFNKEDIQTVNQAIEFFPGRIERDEWVAQAQELMRTGGDDSEILKMLRDRKHMINYSRIGVAHAEDADDLTLISGIGSWIQTKLNALDIYTFRQIANFSKEDEEAVSKAIEFFPGRIHRDEWVPQAKELIHSNGEKTALLDKIKKRKHKIDYSSIGIAHPSEAHDLTQIKGIGPFIQEKLYALDIYTFEQISCFTTADIKTVTEIIEFFPGRIERDRWVEQAKVLASSVNTQKPSADLR